MANTSKTFGLFGPLNFTAGRQGVKLTMPLLVLAAICFFALPAQAQYGGGSGTAGDPYLIYTPEELNAVGARSGDWNKNFQLRADIDLADYMELTTIDQALDESGRTAVELLIARMANPERPMQNIKLQLNVIERSTT